MRTVYLTKYNDEYNKASIARANIVKESDLTITFNFDYENLIGWIFLSTRRAVRRKTLENDGIEIFGSLKEAFVYLQSMAQNRLRELKKQVSEVENQMEVFCTAAKSEKNVEELIRQERSKK